MDWEAGQADSIWQPPRRSEKVIKNHLLSFIVISNNLMTAAGLMTTNDGRRHNDH
jgi:hypothetical protein